jgi:2-iminobutanoate/2-iminopropanoate deaminase
VVDASLAAETRQCLENLHAVCVASGTTLDRALKVTIYTTALEDSAQINQIYAEHFAEEPPARATVGVAALPKDVRIEIEAIVAVD